MFVKLAVVSVREFNSPRDGNDVQYARKAMIMTGISLNLNDLWEESQLSKDHQRIATNYRNHFNGGAVNTAHIT